MPILFLAMIISSRLLVKLDVKSYSFVLVSIFLMGDGNKQLLFLSINSCGFSTLYFSINDVYEFEDDNLDVFFVYFLTGNRLYKFAFCYIMSNFGLITLIVSLKLFN